MVIPSFEEAKKWVREIIFSGPTYQIELHDPIGDEKVFVFLQFGALGEVRDAFCSCEKESCHHISLAIKRVFPDELHPLHERYENSFWKKAFYLLCENIGFDPLTEKEDHYEAFENDIGFKIFPKNQKSALKLKEILNKKEKETPENSLKFSNLSDEEIDHWREGRASFTLRFELSYWSDFSKYAFLLQEEEGIKKISFKEDKEGRPTSLIVDLKSLKFQFHFDLQILSEVIPTLPSLNPNIIVDLDGEREIEKITYNRKEHAFHIQRRSKPAWADSKKRILFDSWVYVKNVGFFYQDLSSPLFQDKIEEDQIGPLLSSHGKVISKYLEGEKISFQQTELNYDLFFDKSWNLHIASYLFQKNDLSDKESAFFGKWAYIKSKGFFPIKKIIFDRPEKIIYESEVSHFVSDHKLFLNERKGFLIHLSGLETKISYKVQETGLSFHFTFEGKVHDFGNFVYSENQGFFLKKIGRLSSILKSGLEIEAKNIASFIQNFREDLELIDHFFLLISPLSKRGLSVHLLDEGIIIKPEITLSKDQEGKNFKIFGSFIYLEGAGFYEIPREAIPLKFQREILIEKDEINSFFLEEFFEIEPFITTIDKRLSSPKSISFFIDNIRIIRRGTLALNLVCKTEQGEIALFDLWKIDREKERYAFTDAGRIDLKSQSFSWLHSIKKCDVETRSLLLSTLDFIKLDAEFSLSVSEGMHDELLPILKELREFKTKSSPNLKGLKSELRHYQKRGVEWLWFLYQNGLSGLLCDEMGLGKTHQAMAIINAIYHESPSLFLIVAPTSVIYHWQEKIKKFLPDIPLFLFHGQGREREQFPKKGIFLTSYGLLRVEKEILTNLNFEAAIFDELQVAKNPKSRLHHALSHIHAPFRLGLTGTPIENNLRELKALFDLIVPGYLPSEARFQEQFLLPIERGEHPERKLLLLRLVRPFLLRRKKKEVLSELPEKSEDKFFADLSDEQRILYKETLDMAKSTYTDLLQPQKRVSYIHIFATLSRLKQICNHPALISKDAKSYKKHASGKWELFKELLNEALASEQKVVVFSQYLIMLDIIELYLQEENIGYTGIRGDTLRRDEAMNRFQNDPDTRVFVGSLQAAGLGIDLTSASNVILYDRWWNPARENQAIDRVHRIGQKWGVQVYKLITRNTIEERIDRIIEKKKKLIEEILPTDDESEIKSLSREELIELLSYTE